MIDQQTKYSHLGLVTEFIGEAQPDKGVKEKVLNGEVQLVYITPESMIETSRYRDMLLSPHQEKLVALVIDEAHCVKTWGDQFRTTFAKIRNLRSLIPKEVNILALTATATTETYYVVTQRLAMSDTSLVALPPNRDNITYEILPKINDVDQLITSLGSELVTKRVLFPKTVIYVRSYSDCSGIYMRLKKYMGSAFTEPEGSPNITGFRLIDMFSRVLTNKKKMKFCNHSQKEMVYSVLWLQLQHSEWASIAQTSEK